MSAPSPSHTCAPLAGAPSCASATAADRLPSAGQHGAAAARFDVIEA
jgi:hypothetical protein